MTVNDSVIDEQQVMAANPANSGENPYAVFQSELDDELDLSNGSSFF